MLKSHLFEIVNKSSTFGKLKLTLVTAYDKSPCTCKSATGRKRTDVETGRAICTATLFRAKFRLCRGTPVVTGQNNSVAEAQRRSLPSKVLYAVSVSTAYKT